MVQPTMGSRCIQAISVRDKTPSKFENLWRLLFKTVKVELHPCLINRVQAPRHEDVWGSVGAHPPSLVRPISIRKFPHHVFSMFQSPLLLSLQLLLSALRSLTPTTYVRPSKRELTPWSWALLDKPPLMNFTIFDWSQRLTVVYKTAFHWSLSWTRSVHFRPPPFYPNFILILSTHVLLGFHSCISPSDFSTNILYPLLFSIFVLYAQPISSSLTWSF
jgi:hypothetical protein